MIRIQRRRRNSRGKSADTLKLYYASDLHGAEQCWRKFLNAGEFYRADALVMGGDIAGKAIVPIELGPNGAYQATFLGRVYRGESDHDLEEFQAAVRYNGFYPYAAPAEELADYRADESARDQLFDRVMVEEAQRWMQLGDERSAASGIPVYVVAGNDDPWTFDTVLRGAERIMNAEEDVVRIGPHEMVSCSYANPTPWNSPRELPEDELYARLKTLADRLERPERAIFNFHVPPYDTGLDKAYQVDDELAVVMRGGTPVEIPVGSRAVRQVIEEYQPLLALHGHVHESRGTSRIGRTLCINPGSEYNTGRIHGVLVTLRPDAVVGHQFVVG